MTIEKKVDLLSKILTQTAIDINFRDRCLASEVSAIAAVSEKFDVAFPPDFSLDFANRHDSEQTTNRILLRLPDYDGEESDITVPADQTTVPCTYSQWRKVNGNFVPV